MAHGDSFCTHDMLCVQQSLVLCKLCHLLY
uniref:Uncharacterized protein n=1 Tax=Rhizophora mucronata TaxID=61149 RepID=A0A2P2NX19_RHIMU